MSTPIKGYKIDSYLTESDLINADICHRVARDGAEASKDSDAPLSVIRTDGNPIKWIQVPEDVARKAYENDCPVRFVRWRRRDDKSAETHVGGSSWQQTKDLVATSYEGTPREHKTHPYRTFVLVSE